MSAEHTGFRKLRTWALPSELCILFLSWLAFCVHWIGVNGEAQMRALLREKCYFTVSLVFFIFSHLRNLQFYILYHSIVVKKNTFHCHSWAVDFLHLTHVLWCRYQYKTYILTTFLFNNSHSRYHDGLRGVQLTLESYASSYRPRWNLLIKSVENLVTLSL